jgi:hypothetical protein
MFVHSVALFPSRTADNFEAKGIVLNVDRLFWRFIATKKSSAMALLCNHVLCQFDADVTKRRGRGIVLCFVYII